MSDSVARKIAAGEVIDRPYSLVRELMDNAVDADARAIDVYLESGGLSSVHVVDDGYGMSREDLELCFLPHATSKIATEADLDTVRSLGFRGEALSSMASVARLDITSKERDAETAHRLTAADGKLHGVAPSQGRPGTSVAVTELFHNLPGRKRFLKRPAAETAMCKSVFVEKALPFSERRYRLFTDGALKLFLPPAPLSERIATCFPEQLHHDLLYDVKGSGEGFSFHAVIGAPDLARRDRRLLQIFINDRRVWEYSLVQAVEYAFEEILHGGIHPAAFVFIELDPELADFNVHPAKKEVKLKNLNEIHSRLVRVLRSFLSGFSRHAPQAHAVSALEPQDAQPDLPQHTQQREKSQRKTRPADSDFGLDVRLSRTAAERAPHYPDPPGDPATSEEAVRYLGQLFGLFLLAEYRGKLYLVDQHAGHERVLFERLLNSSTTQELLIPEEFEPEAEEEAALLENQEALAEIGVVLSRGKEGKWALTALPAGCEANVREVIDTASSRAMPESGLARSFFAVVACKAAIKDGEAVDAVTANALLKEVFSLPDARCPHGRPIWHEITRDELLHRVGRL